MPFGFTRMNENDLYNADTVCNENFDIIEEKILPSIMLTKAQYDALTFKEADTLYAVINGRSATLYLGELPFAIGGGSLATGSAVAIQTGSSASSSGRAHFIDIS